jgi:1-acyl-sn-glycerol-3-phosphate acyltransferase
MRLAVVILWPFMMTFTKRQWVGTENLDPDDGGIILAPNHISWFDPLVLSHVCWDNDRPPRFLAKEALFRIPVAGRIIGGAKQIPVYRESREAVAAVRAAIEAVESGECVIVYPEGTITRDPNLWPMSAKTGAARIALASGRPVVPLAHWGSQEIMAPYVKQFRILPRKTIQVRVGPPVDLSDLRGRPMDAEVLRQASDRIMDAITALLAEIRQEQPPATRLRWRRDGTVASAPDGDDATTDTGTEAAAGSGTDTAPAADGDDRRTA